MNNVTIIGNITRDIETKYLPSGTCVGKFGIAWNEKIKNQVGGYDDKAHFFEVVCWGKTAENIQKFFYKGKQIGITGSLSFESWIDQQQQKRSKVVIKLKEFDFIGSKDSAPQQGGYNPNQPAHGYNNQSNAPTYQDGMNQPDSYSQDIPTIDIDNDEIPF